MGLFPTSRLSRSVLAPLLSLWVAGAGCMLGCEGMVAAAASMKASSGHHSRRTTTIVASGNACSSRKSHDCCRKSSDEGRPKASQSKSANTALIESGRSSAGPMACPFALSKTAVVTKAHGGDESASPVFAGLSLSAQSSLEQTAPLSTPLRLPNRGHTYLRCCAFLI